MNYSIRASASSPTGTGKENEIVVVTTVSIGETQINCATVPTTRSDGTAIQNGDICILVKTDTGNPFNALKKNALYAFVGQCEQRISGAWTNTDAYIFQRGSWEKFSGSLPLDGTPIDDCTWEDIATIGEAGLASSYWDIGDEKTITLSTGEIVILQIIGFAHDSLSSGSGTAPITFCFKDCMDTTRPMQDSLTNSGGYSGSPLYTIINGEIFDSLPTDLRAVLKTVDKCTSMGYGNQSIATTQEKLFLLSEIEVLGSITSSTAGEGTVYSYFTTADARIKNIGGVPRRWWLRSPVSSGINYYIQVVSDEGGATANGGANSSIGIALALCV